jgi:hypothetical protein
MSRSFHSLLTLLLALPTAVRAQEKPEKTADEKAAAMVARGLEWLVKNQTRDGCWEAQGGQYRPAMTGFAGLALLAEGSTTSEGKYAENLRRAVRWHLSQAQPSGVLVSPGDPSMAGRYMLGHGYAMLFLAQVYAIEKDEKRHAELGKVLEKAVEFAGKAATSRGGWGYVSGKDGNDFDEGCCTLAVLHALYATQAAGGKVPKEVLDKANDYLTKSTTVVKKDQDAKKTEAGIIYSLAAGAQAVPRPALTVAALAVMHQAGQGSSDRAIQWLNYSMTATPLRKMPANRTGYDEYTHFYLGFATHALGEEGHAKLRPDLAQKQDASLWTWTRFRDLAREEYQASQAADGSWPGSTVGPVFATAVKLIVLQLDRKNLTVLAR